MIPPVVVEFPEKFGHTSSRAAAGAALNPAIAPISPELQFIISTWPDLPEAIRAAMVALVQPYDAGEQQQRILSDNDSTTPHPTP